MYPASVEDCFEDTADEEEFNRSSEVCRAGGSPGSVSVSPKSAMEQEKRIRREIANSNERRRMQSINAGFQSLRALLPQQEGEKLSKAAILQQTADFIYQLEQERTRLLTQNCQLKRLLGQQQQQQGGAESDSVADSPGSVRRNPSQGSAELEPAGLPAEEQQPAAAAAAPAAAELLELRAELEQERRHRLALEEQLAEQQQPSVPASPAPAQYKRTKPESSEPPVPSPSAAVLPPLSLYKRPKVEPSEPAGPESVQLVIGCQQTAGILRQQLQQQQQPAALSVEPLPLPTPPPPPPQQPAPVVHRPLYVGSTTSRQNLDTIVEAIRHLEGDHLFQDPAPLVKLEPPSEPLPVDSEPLQEAPLELTTHDRTPSGTAADTYRPGVIVVQPRVPGHHPGYPRPASGQP